MILDFYEIQKLKHQTEETFVKYSNNFLIFDDEATYYSVTPIRYLLKAIKSYQDSKNQNKRIINLIFDNFDNFITKIIDKYQKIIQNNNREKEKYIFKNLPSDVTEYLKTAAKIKTLLFRYKLSLDPAISEDDLCDLSILLAVFFINTYATNNIVKLLKDDGITFNKIIKIIKFYKLQSSELENIQLDYTVIEKEFAEYFKNEENLKIKDIFKKIFVSEKRTYSVIEHVFDKLEAPFYQYENFDDKCKLWFYSNVFRK